MFFAPLNYETLPYRKNFFSFVDPLVNFFSLWNINQEQVMDPVRVLPAKLVCSLLLLVLDRNAVILYQIVYAASESVHGVLGLGYFFTR